MPYAVLLAAFPANIAVLPVIFMTQSIRPGFDLSPLEGPSNAYRAVAFPEQLRQGIPDRCFIIHYENVGLHPSFSPIQQAVQS